MSNILNNKNPTMVVDKTSQNEQSRGMNIKVSDWPANSSTTTSRGSFLPVAAIEAGANLTQTTELTKAKTAITTVTIAGDASNPPITTIKMAAGGNEPHVPGAKGNQPRPKHDVSNLFIIAEKLTERLD